jgi:hypothetical protein
VDAFLLYRNTFIDYPNFAYIRMNHKAATLLTLALIAFITGCASQPPDVAIVAQTLQTYEVGKTTFADFKRDTGLTIVQRSPAAEPAQPLYLLYQQPTWIPMTQWVYRVPAGSPWRIYGVQHYWKVHKWEWGSSRSDRFTVGDIHHPISILTFGGDGDLINISPANAVD